MSVSKYFLEDRERLMQRISVPRPGSDLAIFLNQQSTPKGLLKCAAESKEQNLEHRAGGRGRGRESSANIARSHLLCLLLLN